MKEQGKSPEKVIPQGQPLIEPSWVQCRGYRCLAVLNKDGKWITYSNGKEITDFIRVISTVREN
jgi:hypothetical protein